MSLNMAKTAIVVARKVDSKIFVLRGQRVILDSDLAELYGVQVRHLNQQVKRKCETISSRLSLSTLCPRIENLEITKCDLK
jgi:hypothetical protein